ncbi:MAG: PAS domain S-box protein [Anaerolineales bacterium]|nr:PAS domain S-box protein [Anaerolineales bacterium]
MNIWRRLIVPGAVIEDRAERQQASLLAALSLVFLLAGGAISVVWVLANPHFFTAPAITAGALLALVGVYALSRTRHHRQGARLMVLTVFGMVCAILLSPAGEASERILALNFLTLAMLLASILLSVRATLVVSALSLSISAAFLFVPAVPFRISYAFVVFIAIMGAFLALIALIRQMYEQKQTESRRRYQALFDQSNDAVLIVGLNGRIAEANRSACQLLGYTRSELHALTFHHIVAPAELLASRERFNALLANQPMPIFECTFRRKDGAEIPVEINVELVHLPDGQPRHVQAIVRDITGRKRGVAARLASEARFKRLTMDSPDTIYIFNLISNRVEFINRQEFLGYSLPELQSPGSVLNQVHPHDLPKVQALWQKLRIDSAHTSTIDFRLRHRAGHWEWVHHRTTVLSFTEDGRPAEVLIVLTLLTEAKRTLAQLHEREAQFQQLVEKSRVIPWVADVNTLRYTYVGPQAVAMLGYPLEAWYAPDFWPAHLHPEDRDAALQYQREATQHENDYEIEYRMLAADGRIVWFRDMFNVERKEDGPGILRGFLIDVTARRQAEEGMRQLQKLESLSVLAGGIAHDFNNLLVAMLGQTSLALTKLPDDSPVRPHVEKAVSAANQAARLTQQLLAYSGRGQFQVVPLSLNALIDENRHLFTATIPKHIQLQIDLAAALPTIEADVTQIQQVLMNLIINAAEALGEQVGTITLATSLRQTAVPPHADWHVALAPKAPGPYVALEVRDPGSGIPADILSRIFDPFFTTKATGHGLGLAAALGIIKQHAGGLFVHSSGEEGTAFMLLLPASSAPELPTPPPTAAGYAPSHGLVLVIDDEAPVREAVGDILELVGIEVLAAPDGESGLALYQAHRAEVALVLLDLSMPGWNGEQTLQALRAVNPALRVILSSGYSESESVQRFIGKEVSGFLQKPYRAETLLQTVQAHLALLNAAS